MHSDLHIQCDSRSVAEISIVQSLFGVGSFLLMFMASYPLGAKGFLIAFCVWVGFMLWHWVGLIRRVWKWERDRLGISVFKIIQYTFAAMNVFSLIINWELREDFKIILSTFAIFDITVGLLIFNFLILVWFARCRLSWRDYFNIASIYAMIVLQVWFTDFSMY